MENIIKVILFIFSISSQGQVLLPDFHLKMFKADSKTLKGQPKEIFYETVGFPFFRGAYITSNRLLTNIPTEYSICDLFSNLVP